MKLDLSKIKFSNNDLRNNILIPSKLTPKLAEFIGVIVGDGHVGVYKNNIGMRTFANYEIRITGNLKDCTYYSKYVNDLANELFNIRFYILKLKNDNSVMLYKNSKALYYFFSQCMAIPQIKDKVRIPKQIRNGSLEVKSSFLKGLADSDFIFTIKNKKGKLYPVVQGVSKSEKLINDVSYILNKLNIKHSIYLDKTYNHKRDRLYVVSRIYINGLKNVKNWFNLIGFSNPRHTQKWNEFCDKKRAGKDLNPRPKG